jgi:hypothetical protein
MPIGGAVSAVVMDGFAVAGDWLFDFQVAKPKAMARQNRPIAKIILDILITSFIAWQKHSPDPDGDKDAAIEKECLPGDCLKQLLKHHC